MLTIRRLISLHTLFYFLAISLIILGVRVYWIYPDQKLLATETQKSDLIRINLAINQQVKNLAMLNQQYAGSQIVYNVLHSGMQLSNDNKQKISKGMSQYGIIQSNIIVLNEDKYKVEHSYVNGINTIIKTSKTDQTPLPLSWLDKPIMNFIERQPVQFFQEIEQKIYIHSSYPIAFKDVQYWIVLSKKLDLSNITNLSTIEDISLKKNNAHIQRYIFNSNSGELTFDNFKMAAAHRLCINTIKGQSQRCLTVKHNRDLIPQIIDGATLVTFLALLLIPCMFFLFMLKYFIHPLERSTLFLKQSVRRNKASPIKWHINIFEISEAIKAFNQLISTVKKQESTLEKMTNTDKLTNISNRRAFDSHLHNSWRRLSRHGGSASLIMIDIDYFKRYNDNYGHIQGDKALQSVASLINKNVNRADEICARYGGEEFALLIQSSAQKDINSLLDKITEELDNFAIIHDKSPFQKLTLSVGICTLDVKENELRNYGQADWVNKADKALYEAKESGRNKRIITQLQIAHPQLVIDAL